jgi:hypothetical protein
LKGLLTFHFTFRSSVKIIRPARALHTHQNLPVPCVSLARTIFWLPSSAKERNTQTDGRGSKKYEFIRVDGGGSSENIVIESEIWLRLKRKSDFSCAPHWQLTFCASCETETAGV